MNYAIALSGLLTPMIFAAIILIFGTPHLAVQYTFRDNGDAFNPFAARHYTSCTYWGWTGAHAEPAFGDCPWFRWYK